MSVNVRLTIDPSVVVTVTDAEYADLLLQKLIYSTEGGGPIPYPTFSPNQYAELRRVTGVRTRRAAFPFGCGGSYDAAGANFSNIGVRHIMKVPVATTRWRYVIGNYDYMRQAPGGAGAMLRAVYFGRHLRGAGAAGTGQYDGAPVLAIPDPNAAIPADGTRYVSPWVTDPAAQFAPNVEHIIAHDVTASAAVLMHRGAGRSYITFGLNTSGSVSPAPAPADSGAVLMDSYVEYEFVDNGAHPVGVAIGDSITEGKGLYMVKSWPSQFSGATGAVMVNAACSGVYSDYYVNPAAMLWKRLPLATYAPDFAHVTLGTNDASSPKNPIATFQSNMLAIVANLQALGISRVYLDLFPPRTGLVAGDAQDVLRGQYRAFLASLPAGSSGAADFDTALRDPAAPLQMRADWSQGDGLHPTIAGASRMAREAGSLHTSIALGALAS